MQALERLYRSGAAPAGPARGPRENQASPARHSRGDAVRLAPAAGKKAISFAKTLAWRERGLGLGSRIVTAAANAALANGMLGHADETDDSHSPSQTHPGCGVVAAAFAMAERERASGTALLRAVALGYDVCCRLTQSLNALQFRAAGHSTHSFGPTFGAAAAAGALAKLDERGVRHLLSYAAAAGFRRLVLDAGRGAYREGVRLRRHARAQRRGRGGDGRPRLHRVEDVFSGERQLLRRLRALAGPGGARADLGQRYEIMNADIKRWAVGSPIQAPLDSLLELIARTASAPGRSSDSSCASRTWGEHHGQPRHARHLHAASVRRDAGPTAA